LGEPLGVFVLLARTAWLVADGASARVRVCAIQGARMIDQRLLQILACPADKAPVEVQEQVLVCTACGRRYPIRAGIPVMLLDQAELPSPCTENRQ
jgi:uncharacterized protein YbaR (Trm112 family)